MSIDMEKTDTMLEKIDVLTGLIAKMGLAHIISDNAMFDEAHAEAMTLGMDLMIQIESMEE